MQIQYEIASYKDFVQFTVEGDPETQGSKKPVLGKARGDQKPKMWLVEGSFKKAKRWATWRAKIAEEARLHAPEVPWDGPVVLITHFFLRKPASASKTQKLWPVKARTGDADKLARLVGDALTGIIYSDDSRIVVMLSTKEFGDPRVEITAFPLPHPESSLDVYPRMDWTSE